MPRRPARPLTARLAGRVPVVLAMVAVGATAQTAPEQQAVDANAGAPGRAFTITPTFTATQTISDNANLGTGDDKKSGSVTELSPGIHVRSTGGRFVGFVDYELDGLVYSQGSSKTELLNSLNAAVLTEAIENWAYVDFKASIAQQSMSAFGTQSFDPTLQNGNRTEVASYSLSPYVQGRLGGLVDYSVRLTHAISRSDDSAGFNTTTNAVDASLAGGTALSLLDWSADVSRILTQYADGNGETQDTQAVLGLNYKVTPELKLSVNGGHESDNFNGSSIRSGAIYGGGVDWHPSEISHASASIEHRLFGNSYAISFEHRTPRTAWVVSDTRDVVTGNNQPSVGSQSAGALASLLFASITDPVQRAQAVASYLRQQGLDPNSTINFLYLSNSVSLQQNAFLSFTWMGVRDTVTLLANRSESTLLASNASGLPDSFNQSDVIRQVGFTLVGSHKLTPQSTLDLTVQQMRTTGQTADLATTVRSAFLNWSSQIGKHTFVTLGARHAEQQSTTVPYYETAVIGSLRFDF
ncbi:MAG: TIGR03016 family PEP-CTERM system-associated outer membrane protein [Proteobacteria bacterium]|nr:TIGR03016 family PEP-CTERM system-associated outer membrane protein [Pseudomonadota bacterium]